MFLLRNEEIFDNKLDGCLRLCPLTSLDDYSLCYGSLEVCRKWVKGRGLIFHLMSLLFTINAPSLSLKLRPTVRSISIRTMKQLSPPQLILNQTDKNVMKVQTLIFNSFKMSQSRVCNPAFNILVLFNVVFFFSLLFVH